MIELTSDWKEIYNFLNNSGVGPLEGLAHEIFLFECDEKYKHPNTQTFVNHNAWGMKKLAWKNCTRTITLEKKDKCARISVTTKFPNEEPINEQILILSEKEDGTSLGTIRKQKDDKYIVYSFDVTKNGNVKNFKEKSFGSLKPLGNDTQRSKSKDGTK